MADQPVILDLEDLGLTSSGEILERLDSIWATLKLIRTELERSRVFEGGLGSETATWVFTAPMVANVVYTTTVPYDCFLVYATLAAASGLLVGISRDTTSCVFNSLPQTQWIQSLVALVRGGNEPWRGRSRFASGESVSISISGALTALSGAVVLVFERSLT